MKLSFTLSIACAFAFSILASFKTIENNITCTTLCRSSATTNLEGFRDHNNRVTLSWISTRNELINHIEVEKSVNGKDFSTSAIMFTSESIGIEKYTIKGLYIQNTRTYYRLKMHYKNSEIVFSNTIILEAS